MSSRFFKSIVAWITDHWSGLLSLLGSIIFGVIGVLPHLESELKKGNLSITFIVFLAMGILAVLAGGLGQILLSPRVSSLKAELEIALGAAKQATEDLGQADADNRKKYQAILNNELFVLYNFLGFSNDERINLLMHDDQDQMYMIGRYSTKLAYRRKGRSHYKDDEGVVGLAWNNGNCFVDDLPEGEYEYARECVIQFKMKREDAFNLRMKSRTIGAVTVRDIFDQQIAVIVFESMRPAAFTKQDLLSLMQNGEEKRISLLLDQLKDILPDPNIASEEGF